MLKNILTFTIAILVLCSTSGLFAQENDGSSEAGNNTQMKLRGQQGDKNGKRKRPDNKRSQQRRPDVNTMFTRMDQNNDGQLSADEVPNRLMKRMQQIDTDQSDTISKKELVVAFQKRNQSNMQNGSPMQRRKNGERGKMSDDMKKKTIQELSPEALLSRLDKNNDQMVSIEEVPKRMKEKFSKLDSDGDNQLNTKELVSMVERLKAAGGKSNRYSTDPDKTNSQMPKRPPRR